MSWQSQERRQAGAWAPAQGNRWIGRGLTQAALGASHSKDTYLRSFYWRIASKRGDKKARIATAHKQLEIAFLMIRDGTHFQDLGANHLDLRHKERTQKCPGKPARRSGL